MVVLLTPAAVSSPHVKRNIEYALGATCRAGGYGARASGEVGGRRA